MFVKRDPADPSPRRVPTQARSKERVERILDAAARVFAEAGYEAATTEAIAAHAATSIGSVYQFFPNKEALWDAIANRYRERTRALFDRLMSTRGPSSTWGDLLDEIIDAFAAFERTDLDFRAVWANWHRAAGVLQAGHALNREFALRAEQVLAIQAPSLPKAKRALVATMTVETISAMLILAARGDAAFSKNIVRETKLLLRRYLTPYTKA